MVIRPTAIICMMQDKKRAAKYAKYIDGSKYMSNKGVPEGPKPPTFPKYKRKYNMSYF